jgi:hypothetical protein
MTWTDKVGDLLKQYTSSGGAAAAAQPAPDVQGLRELFAPYILP